MNRFMHMSPRLLVLLTLTTVVAASVPIRAADYYLSPAGDDTAAGRAASPWRSIERANRHAFAPGDRVLFKAGEEFSGNLAITAPGSTTDAKAPITIGSYGQGRAMIRAGRGTGVRVEDLGGIVVRDLVVIGEPHDENQGFGVQIIHRRPDKARLEGIRVENVEARGFRWAGIYVGGVPPLPGFEPPEGSQLGFRDVRIRGCKALANTYNGILVDGNGKNAEVPVHANQDVSIVACVAANNPGDPRYTQNHSGNGILLADTDGGLIERCVATNNGADNGGQSGGPVGIWAYASNRVTIQSCESYGNRTGGQADGGGFDLDGGVTNSVIQYCYSHDNDGPGFLVWNYAGATYPLADNVIRYNISAGDGRKHRYGGISVGTSDAPVRNLLVHNNTVYATRIAGAEPSCVHVFERPGEGLRFVNNLFVTEGGVPAIDCEERGEGVRFLGNAYWAASGAFRIRHGDGFDELGAWRAAMGQERWRGKDMGLYADPRLSGLSKDETVGVNGSLSDLGPFRLRAGSPLIDAGLDLDEFQGRDHGSRDFWGTPLPRGRGRDIGADEYDP